MQAYGYNTVRVFIDPGSWTRDSAAHNGIAGDYNVSGLDVNYLNDVVDFVQKAEAHGIYVIPSLDGYPHDVYYDGLVTPQNCMDQIDWPNAQVMCAGHVNAERQYVTDFVTYLQSHLTASQLNAILAYQLSNEQTFTSSNLPFVRTDSGFAPVTADGMSYDMSIPSKRQDAADSNLVNWANTLTNAIKAVDSGAMTTVGFFTYSSVGKPSGPSNLLPAYENWQGDPCPTTCFPGRPAVLTLYSNVDFVDLHLYPMGPSYSMNADLASTEWSLIYGPLIMGEYGAFKSAYPDYTSAAYPLRPGAGCWACHRRPYLWRQE